MKNVFVFPGQGSQKIGMASSFMNGYKAGMETMQEIEDAISFKLADLIENGTMEELTKAENAQPAIFAVGMMCVRILENEYGYNLARRCKYLAGHSLGEYTALCASGVFSLSDAAKLVRRRGELMSQAFPDSENYSMVALIGVCVDDIEELISDYRTGKQICVIANDNSDSQVVISGHRKAVSEFVEKAKAETQLKKAIELQTSGAFHSPLMAPIAIEFDKVLASGFVVHDFKIPVIMNVTAQPLNNKDEVKIKMTSQITGRVRWRETMRLVTNDAEVTKVVEVAPGKVLTNMLKRANPEMNTCTLETVAQIEEFIKAEEEED
ncbi:MAG: ACP S-malonyltransferase [Alphaproteobacteria bacterium]|nr:ACP S-malonyltransferase [Alphaproteobacteria bacterium]